MPASIVGPLLEKQTTTGFGPIKIPTGPNRTYFISAVANAGANGTATVNIESSNDNINWLRLGTITFTSINDTPEMDGFSSYTAWKFLRANVKTITGAGMTLNGSYGVHS